MLSDPLYLGVPGTLNPATAPNTDISTVIAFPAVSLGAGASKRKANVINTFSVAPGSEESHDEINFTISHSETNENKPYKTSREVKRLDVSRTDDNGVSVTASFYIVGVIPITSMFTEDDVRILEKMLALFALYGPSTSSSDWSGTSNDQTNYRILRGEA
jgi:hypothetical protein